MLRAFHETPLLDPARAGREARRLGELASRPAAPPIAPGLVFLADAEETFYLSNNLPEQLRNLFASLSPRRLDEDALEAACERARALLLGSSLLDDAVSQIRLALSNLGVAGTLHLRRDGQDLAETGDGPRGAAIALKRVWARDWDFDPTLERLDATGTVGIDAHPVLLFAGQPGREDDRASRAASAALGRPVRAHSNELGVCGLREG